MNSPPSPTAARAPLGERTVVAGARPPVPVQACRNTLRRCPRAVQTDQSTSPIITPWMNSPMISGGLASCPESPTENPTRFIP